MLKENVVYQSTDFDAARCWAANNCKNKYRIQSYLSRIKTQNEYTEGVEVYTYDVIEYQDFDEEQGD